MRTGGTHRLGICGFRLGRAALRWNTCVAAAQVLSLALGLSPAFAGHSAFHSQETTHQQAAAASQDLKLSIRIIDETGVAVASALVSIRVPGTQYAIKRETDYAGRIEFNKLQGTIFQVQIEKEGFYAKTIEDVRAVPDAVLEVVLDHQQELKEVMDVVYSAPAIDPEKTAVTQDLSGQEIVNLPYPTTRDIKNVFPLMPGVVKDNDGRFHFNGSGSGQTQPQLDGFDVANPETGTLRLHVSPDAVRSINVLTSGYGAEYGKGSGGIVGLATGIGDDRYRFSATNFIPSIQSGRGINLNDWTPRATFSGPLHKKRAWFFDAADGLLKLNIVKSLPPGADRDSLWQMSNLSKAQVNLTESNILSGSLLINRFREDHNGLSRFNPIGATVDLREMADMVWLRDQAYLKNGVLLETGFAITRYHNKGIPLGSEPFIITPEGNRGNFFKASDNRARRAQWLASALLPTVTWHGRHQFKVGLDLGHVTLDQVNLRRPTLIVRENGAVAGEITFIGSGSSSVKNLEASGYAVDRWSLSDRLFVEGGLRFDRDRIIERVSISPRLGLSLILSKDRETKLTLGTGVVYDPTNLGLIARGLDASRLDLSFGSAGVRPAAISFRSDQQSLKRPRFLNSDIALERRLPASFFLRLALMEKRGSEGFAFVNLEPAFHAMAVRTPGGTGLESGRVTDSGALALGRRACIARCGPSVLSRRLSPESAEAIQPLGALFALTNIGRDRYDGLEVTVRRGFRQGYEFLASYVRSRATSNAVMDFNIDNPTFGQQAGGPLAWDTPNRFITRGWLPLIKKFTFGYFLEWRDGYPFSVVDQDQNIVGPPGSRRFPAYFSLDTHFERRVGLLGYKLAIRAGFNDVTNRHNSTSVNNNIDSPGFLTFGSHQHRVFTARIRFLGKK